MRCSSLVDLATAVVAFMFEKREDWRLLWWLVLQRFGYRQLLYYVLAKSVTTAAQGPLRRLGQARPQGHGQPGNAHR